MREGGARWSNQKHTGEQRCLVIGGCRPFPQTQAGQPLPWWQHTENHNGADRAREGGLRPPDPV